MIYKEDSIAEKIVIRTFKDSVDPIELQWHRDNEDREITTLGKTDWKIQLEDELPKVISNIFIPKGKWHRVIKGSGELKVKIVKYL